MDKGTWFYIVIAGASILYNMYKKNLKKKKEQPSNQAPVSGNNKEGNSWGLDDLISEFQQEYGVEPEAEYAQEEPILQSQSARSSEEELSSKTEAHYSEKQNEKSPKFVDNVDHTDMDVRKTQNAAFTTKKWKDPTNESMPEIDLRQMVIHATILNRPEY